MDSGRLPGSISGRLARNDVVLPLADAVATRGLRIALPLAAAIAVLGAAGVAAGLLDVQAFNLDGERNVPAVFSTLLLAAAAGLVLVFSSTVHPGRPHRPGIVMAFVVAWMSLDEFAAVHEFLERRTGVDWQTIYLPLMLVAGVTWVVILRELRVAPRAAVYWTIGASAWLVAQALEFFQWDGDRHVRGYAAMMVPEELLEMVGSSFLGLAMLAAIGLLVQQSAAGEKRS